MAAQNDVRFIENLTGHRFLNQHWATTAITAAGANESDHHGNRMCARFGRLFIEFYVLDNGHKAQVPPSTVQDCTTDALRKTRHARIAREKGIDTRMRFSPRQRDDPATDTTLSNAICAIIGAVWQDSHDIAAPFKTIESLGLGEPIPLQASGSRNGEETNPFQNTPSDQDISWAIESAAITENPTPLLSPVTEEPRPLPADLGISLSDLTVSGPELFIDSPSESCFNVYPASDIDALLACADFQTSQQPSPSMSPPMLPDSPMETLRPDSIELAADLDGGTANTGRGPTESGQANVNREQTAKIAQSSCAKKRKAPNADKSSKRINSQHEKASLGQIECVQVKEFIKMEQDKCAKLNIPYNDRNYLAPAVVEWIATLDKEDERVAVSMISTLIGSAESIALLQHILLERRAVDGRTKPGEDLAIVDRVREIQQLGSRIACHQFLRRCHIWKLYKDIAHEASSQGFVVLTSENVSTPQRGRAGNPNNFRVSEITNAMICELAPEVDVDGSEYQKQRRYCNKLRKLGERLDLLIETFGFGVLGLLQTQDSLEAVDFTIRLNDETILLPTDRTFKHCVQLLGAAQGNTIRDFSLIVEDAVRSIFDCMRPGPCKFAIENINAVQILSQPKGSAELLKLLSGSL